MKHQGFGYVVKNAPQQLLLKDNEYHSDVRGGQPIKFEIWGELEFYDFGFLQSKGVTIGPLTVLYNDHIIYLEFCDATETITPDKLQNCLHWVSELQAQGRISSNGEFRCYEW